MFALKSFASFGHMDGWEYQDCVLALCSFMCDALCSVFPKTSNQAWGWTVPFWRTFNWKVKISTRLGDKSRCPAPPPRPRPPLCLSLIHMYESFTQHVHLIPFLRPGASKCPAATRGLPKQHTALQAESHTAICKFVYRGLRAMIHARGAPGTRLLMGLLSFHHCWALLAAWWGCVSQLTTCR